ncbi:MAG: V-type ATP synthase subunit D [Caldisericia bacterium]|nr:V-type ATP synthase subunit D [Caldisericia bacterium]MDD4614083.1 V-type ATP synthase subunit D [Caldisericia bacterium]
MAQRVSPTRMKLLEIRKRHKTAKRGHKLLKDKLEALARELVELAKEFEKQEQKVGDRLPQILEQFLVLRTTVTDEEMRNIVSDYPAEFELTMSQKNIMNIVLPEFHIHHTHPSKPAFHQCGLNPAFDIVLREFDSILDDLLKLAELEFSIYEVAKIVEMTKRRVNALEYVLVPELEETIKYITSKLEENERSTTIRLMKIKDILSKRSY